MRVAVFTETFLPKTDGIVTVVCLLLDHLHKRGIETVVVAPKMGVDRYNSTPVIGVPGVKMPLYPELRVGPPTLSTYHEVKRFNPDVVHLIHPALVGIPGMLMAKRLDVPMLASFHLDLARISHHFGIGFMEPLVDQLTKIVFNAADFSLAPSRMVMDYMERIGIERVGLWKRGVDAERFNPRFYSEAMRDHLSQGHPEDTIMLYVGRLSNEKQINHLKAVLEQVPGTRLALVGDGPAREELETHFAGTKTHFVGYLKGEALSQAYASADMFVFPSAMETFGLVVVEAMAAGLPVVASRVGGVRDVVREGINGYSFESGDIPALVDGVRNIAADPVRMKAMGQSARAFAETQSWDAMMDEVVDLYGKLLEQRQPAALTA
ncbi:MAG: glycosyltransferase family 1 protein [Anaerolineae bacterium]|nr:glycosyltransferase family 1 protein [Anaerolineae bacterium]